MRVGTRANWRGGLLDITRTLRDDLSMIRDPFRVRPEEGEDVEVDGDPWVFDETREISRRRIGHTIVVLYGVLVLAALVLVARGLDAAAALFVIGPFGVVVAAVMQHYFWRGRL